MNRNTLILLFCFIFPYTVHSQTAKNNWLIGGLIEYQSTNYKSEAGSKSVGMTLKINPNVGYFILNRTAVGVKTRIGRSGYKQEDTNDWSIYWDFNAGPFLRYYLMDNERRINVFAEGYYQHGFTQDNIRKLTTQNTYGIMAGPVLYFNSSVAIEFAIGFSTLKNSGFSGKNNSIFTGIGIQAYLEKD